jgi:hypothetical protein
VLIAVMGHSMRKIFSSLRLALPHICSMLTPAYAGVTLMSQITRSVICLWGAHRYMTQWSAPGWTLIEPGKVPAVSVKTRMRWSIRSRRGPTVSNGLPRSRLAPGLVRLKRKTVSLAAEAK